MTAREMPGADGKCVVCDAPVAPPSEYLCAKCVKLPHVTNEELAEVERLHEQYARKGEPIPPSVGVVSVALRALGLAHKLAAEVRALRGEMADAERAWLALRYVIEPEDLDPSSIVAIRVGEMDRVLRGVEPALTPETVLRAMLAAYRAAMFTAMRAYVKAPLTGREERRAYERLRGLQEQIEMTIAWLVEGDDDPLASLSDALRADYEARRSGARPLHAPPLEGT